MPTAISALQWPPRWRSRWWAAHRGALLRAGNERVLDSLLDAQRSGRCFGAPVAGRRVERIGDWTRTALDRSHTAALAGCFLFFFNVGSYWNLYRADRHPSRTRTQVIADGLAIGVAFGIVGALMASWLGDRRGRLPPIGVGAALTVGAVLPLLAHFGVLTFVGSAIAYNFVWNLSLAFSTARSTRSTSAGAALPPRGISCGRRRRRVRPSRRC